MSYSQEVFRPGYRRCTGLEDRLALCAILESPVEDTPDAIRSRMRSFAKRGVLPSLVSLVQVAFLETPKATTRVNLLMTLDLKENVSGGLKYLQYTEIS